MPNGSDSEPDDADLLDQGKVSQQFAQTSEGLNIVQVKVIVKVRYQA